MKKLLLILLILSLSAPASAGMTCNVITSQPTKVSWPSLTTAEAGKGSITYSSGTWTGTSTTSDTDGWAIGYALSTSAKFEVRFDGMSQLSGNGQTYYFVGNSATVAGMVTTSTNLHPLIAIYIQQLGHTEPTHPDCIRISYKTPSGDYITWDGSEWQTYATYFALSFPFSVIIKYDGTNYIMRVYDADGDSIVATASIAASSAVDCTNGRTVTFGDNFTNAYVGSETLNSPKLVGYLASIPIIDTEALIASLISIRHQRLGCNENSSMLKMVKWDGISRGFPSMGGY